MTGLVWAFALLTAAVHVLVFVWEALLFPRPSVHLGIFGVPTADVPAVRLWAFGVGFYNLFIAGCLVAGVVLLLADRSAMSRPRGAGITGALAEGLPPLVALVALAATAL